MKRSLFILPVFSLAITGATLPPRHNGGPVRLRTIAPHQLHGTALRLLAAHNRERALVGAGPLQWDAALAASAASYGPTLAATGRLDHSPRASRPGQSENLWMGPRGRYAPEQMVGLWSAEKSYFRPGIFPAVSRTGNWMHVSHYTQMVWPATTRVGCAIYSAGYTDYLICRYSPKGNQDGRAVG